jgi:hypothetical protein
MIMGPGDPNYSSPPDCWLKANGNAPLHIEGATKGAALNFTGPNRPNDPGLWLSATQQYIYVTNLTVQYPARGVVISECSNNVRSGRCQAVNVYLDNVNMNIGEADSTHGPSWDIAPGGFWIWISNSSASANNSAPGAPISDQSQAMTIDSSGLIYIKDFRIGGNSGIKIKNSNGNPNGVSIDHVTLDASAAGPCSPVVWITNTGGAEYDLNAITNADCGGTSYAVEVDSAAHPTDVKVSSVQGQGQNTKGPMIILNQYNVNNAFPADPIVNGQLGFYNNRVLGETDVARKLMVPQPIQFTNGVPPPASWQRGPWIRVATGVAGDPSGGNNAVRVSDSGPENGATFYSVGRTFSGGDWIVIGGWFRSPDGSFTGGIAMQSGWSGSCVSTFPQYIQPSLPQTTTNWQWIEATGKIATGGRCTFSIVVRADSAHRTDAYGLVANLIPAGTWDDQTVLDYANSLSSYDAGWRVGTVGGVATTTYAFGSVQLKVYTVSTLPPASSLPAGTQVIVSDSIGYAPGACKGGGSDYMLAISNGSSWSCH